MKHTRWAVRYTNYAGGFTWVTTRGGWTDNFSAAFLYSKKGLAQNIANGLIQQKYKDVKMIPVTVSIQDESVL